MTTEGEAEGFVREALACIRDDRLLDESEWKYLIRKAKKAGISEEDAAARLIRMCVSCGASIEREARERLDERVAISVSDGILEDCLHRVLHERALVTFSGGEDLSLRERQVESQIAHRLSEVGALEESELRRRIRKRLSHLVVEGAVDIGSWQQLYREMAGEFGRSASDRIDLVDVFLDERTEAKVAIRFPAAASIDEDDAAAPIAGLPEVGLPPGEETLSDSPGFRSVMAQFVVTSVVIGILVLIWLRMTVGSEDAAQLLPQCDEQCLERLDEALDILRRKDLEHWDELHRAASEIDKVCTPYRSLNPALREALKANSLTWERCRDSIEVSEQIAVEIVSNAPGDLEAKCAEIDRCLESFPDSVACSQARDGSCV